MKSQVRPLLVLLVCFAFWGCDEDSSFSPSRTVRGSGNVIEATYQVSDFDGVAFGAIGDVHITQGDAEGLRIVGEDNLIDELIVEVKDRALTIRISPNTSLELTEPLDFYVDLKTVLSVILSGAGDIDAPSLTNEGDLTLFLSGTGDIDVDDIETQRLDVVLSGVGDVRLAGQITEQHVTVSGLGNYLTRGLSSERATVLITGVGRAEVHAAERLVATISGNGDICFDGDPETSVTVSGSGTVTSCDD